MSLDLGNLYVLTYTLITVGVSALHAIILVSQSNLVRVPTYLYRCLL